MLTYAQQIAARFPIGLEVVSSDETVSLIWASCPYEAESITDFAQIDEDIVIVGPSQSSLDIPAEIANSTTIQLA